MKTNMRILVVDDEEAIGSILSQILTKDGHEVTAVSSGEKALEIFREEPCPVVISDIMMEGMNGIDLLKEIKQLNSETQVLMITGYPAIETVISAMQIGAYDYITKPFKDIDLIRATVNRAIEKALFINENNNLAEILKENKEELDRLREAFWEKAIQDDLTGLHSYRYFHDNFSAEILRCRRHENVFSLLFVDIDLFKEYNKVHGKLEADNVLRELAMILKKRLRRSDVLARYGGDEFAILLPETKKDDAKALAEEICNLVKKHPFQGRKTLPEGNFTVTIGVASFPEDGEDMDSLTKAMMIPLVGQKKRMKQLC
jgi:diguanylate cyclase (GGDEF)-like protein